MPTGYTAKISEGTEMTAREFIMNCSRAFGALIMMRDEPLDAQIPEKFEPSDYGKMKAEESRAELARIQSLTSEEAEAERDKEYQLMCESEFSYYKKAVELAERYKRTIDQVKMWNPPTEEHVGLKDFCLKQLEDSLESDCYRAFKPYYAPLKPLLDTWIAEKIERLHREIKYYEKQYKEEVERTESLNEWLRQLRESF